MKKLRGFAPRARHKNRPGRGSLLASLRPHQPGRFLWRLRPPRFASGSGFHGGMKPFEQEQDEEFRMSFWEGSCPSASITF
jgi:hypothetical protein